jgi:hypothetical protein
VVETGKEQFCILRLFQLQLLLLLVPTLLIVGLSESLQRLTASRLNGSVGELGGSYVHWWGDASCIGSKLDWPWDAHIDEFGFRCCSTG